MKYILVVIGLISFQSISFSQACDYFPADCPDDGWIDGTKDSLSCIENDIVPQEVTMQNNLRRLVTSMMEEISKRKKWEVYEFTELRGEGELNAEQNAGLPYPYRRPYIYTISFDLIVNQDSLRAWQNWYKNDLTNKANAVVQQYTTTDNSSEKPFADSAMFYANLMGKYLSDHADEYQKAILSNDTKYLKKHDADVKKIQDKIDKFTNSANGERDKNFSTANTKDEDLQAYRKRKTILFRTASTLRVTFIFNERSSSTLDDDTKLVKPLSVPGTSLAVLFHNSDPDQALLPLSFQTNPDFAFLLFGKWITKPDQYRMYKASYQFDKTAMDKVTIKKIPSDKVQTVFVVLEGRPKYINEFLQDFQSQELNKQIVSQ